MDDAEELAVLREFASKTSDKWACMGDFYIGIDFKGTWVARRIADSSTRGVSYLEGSVLAESKSPGECILAARAKLAAERDAKDAPRLREENKRMRAALQDLTDACKDESWDNKNFLKWQYAKELLKEVQE